MRRRSKANQEEISSMVISSLSSEQLQRAYDFIQLLETYKSKDKLYTTYVKGTEKALAITQTGKVYCNFKIEGTVTGRLSCGAFDGERGKLGTSFHTIPREDDDNIRSLYIAKKGNYFGTADFGAMEMRIMAHESGDHNLINAFFSGEDLHKYTASLLFDKNPENVTSKERQMAKSVSFLIIYGGGPYKLTRTVSVPMDVAVATIDRYKEIFPGVFRWMDKVILDLHENYFTENIFGRRRHLLNVKSPSENIRKKCERQAVNFRIQSAASDILCFCVLDIMKEFEKRGMGSKVIATVHDSVEFTGPKDEFEEASFIVYDKMTNYPLLREVMNFNCKVPMAVDIGIGPSFGEFESLEYNKNRVLNKEKVLECLG